LFHALHAILIKDFEWSRLSQRIKLLVDLKQDYFEDFRAGKIAVRRSIPATRTFVYQQSSETDVQTHEHREDLLPIEAARYENKAKTSGNP
jgi:hypothetical protein